MMDSCRFHVGKWLKEVLGLTSMEGNAIISLGQVTIFPPSNDFQSMLQFDPIGFMMNFIGQNSYTSLEPSNRFSVIFSLQKL